jgi:hypothetical protein
VTYNLLVPFALLEQTLVEYQSDLAELSPLHLFSAALASLILKKAFDELCPILEKISNKFS